MFNYVNDQLAFGTHPERGAVYAFKKTPSDASNEITTVEVEIKDKVGSVIAWGKNNKRPQEILSLIAKNGTAKAGLQVNRKLHYGNGLIAVKHTVENGKRQIVPVDLNLDDYAEIREFFQRNQIKKYAKETIADLENLWIAFPEYILSADFNKINRIKRQRAAWCRYETMNEENGLIENIYISQKWADGTLSKESKYVSEVPHIDPYWTVDEVKAYCKLNKITNFIRPVFFPMLDEAFYPFADWHTSIDNGWIDVANSIPELKKAIFQNQVSIKYLIEIDERYFTQIYADDWDDFSVDERKEKRQEVIDLIDEHLGGNANAGKSIQSMRIDVGDDKTVPAITITAIDDKYKEGSYLPEASAANSEILFPMGVDPSLIGAGIPGGKLGAGSGSDKREAFLIATALKKNDRDITTESIEFIQQYNGWDPSIHFSFENTILTTLDANPTGSQSTVA